MNAAVLQPCANTELFSSEQASFDNSCISSNDMLMALTLPALWDALPHLERTPGTEEPSMLNYIKRIINVGKTLMKH